jgi:hypothetical protein
MIGRTLVALALASTALTVGATASSAANGSAPGSPEYIQRDNQNMLDAYGRQSAPDGQLSPEYIAAGPANVTQSFLQQVADQVQNPTRPILDPGQLVPGWNQGNPYRKDWAGRRGIEVPVAFTNRHGALLRGHVSAPLPGARDPYTGQELEGPFPAVVITTGSIQGSERMYTWLAQDLAERGYIVLTYDVQGQGTSETLPHEGPNPDVPFCNPLAEPAEGEDTGCPGVPFQQSANFVKGTEDALDFMLSRPGRPYENPQAGSAEVNEFNPMWDLIDRRRDTESVTPRRRSKVAIIGHSLGAAAVSHVQGVDRRVETVVALDKLGNGEMFGLGVKPKVPALAVQSEYGFNVTPYWMMGGSSLAPEPAPPSEAPDPKREQATGFDAWRKAGVDTMLVVPRASTHLEYTDITWALPASRYGQDVTSYYVQAWLDKYLKHRRDADRRLLASRFGYLEPKAGGEWAPVQFERADHLSFYFCSGHAFHTAGGRFRKDLDIGRVGGC